MLQKAAKGVKKWLFAKLTNKCPMAAPLNEITFFAMPNKQPHLPFIQK